MVAPDIGGRAIQLQLGDQDFFFVNPDLAGKVLPQSENNVKSGWANYGGDKVWPAPEGWMNDNKEGSNTVQHSESTVGWNIAYVEQLVQSAA